MRDKVDRQVEVHFDDHENFPLPIATPRGLARLKRMLDQTKALTERSLWAMLRPRLKAITALWVITAMNTVIKWVVLFCRPMARP